MIHAEIAALNANAWVLIPLPFNSSISSSARSHFPPLPHAEIAALYVNVLALILLRSISWSRSSARSHRLHCNTPRLPS